jgi:hypothetical protein
LSFISPLASGQPVWLNRKAALALDFEGHMAAQTSFSAAHLVVVPTFSIYFADTISGTFAHTECWI